MTFVSFCFFVANVKNDFYFLKGNGKVNIKEPQSLATKAISQIESAIKLSSN